MSQSRTSNLTAWFYLAPLLAGLLLLLMPPTVAGQAPVEATAEPLTNFIYLPLIRKVGEPCLTPPAGPTLIAPEAEAVIPAEQPITFTWHPATTCGAPSIHYTLQISLESDFSPGAIIHGLGYGAYGQADQSDLYYETGYNLPYNAPGTFYWRVAAYAGEQIIGWSQPRRITVQVSPANQLLENPSFEADQIAPWQQLTPDMSQQVIDDTQVALVGGRYLAVNRQDEIKGNKSFYQEIGPPEAGRSYRLAIWVRASAEAISAGRPRTGRIDLWAYDGAPPREHSTRNFQVKDSQWHCVETMLTVTQSGQAQLRAEIYLTALDGLDVYFDNALLWVDGPPICPPSPLNDGATLISQGQGFDTCAAPTVAQLAAWKQASPFDYFGIYLGGVNHYGPCKSYNQQNQTAIWFADVAQQGWQFIPIWVGPQAPCSGYAARLSNDPELAWSEGVAEAQQTLAAAANLGLITVVKPSTIIYYDMEYYSSSDPACHAAVNAFLAGWSSELQNRGYQAGIYGAASVVNDWYTLTHAPDSVWLAYYVRGSYDRTISVDVVNQAWVAESYWDNHRLFQYSNSHTESWGGVAMNIDNDTADGLVALGGLDSEADRLGGMQLVAANQGWLWRNQELFWTKSGGEQWRRITPPGVERIQDVFFLDTEYGWLVATTTGSPALRLWQTTDGGQSWGAFPLEVEIDIEDVMGDLYLDFIDPQRGWLAVELASGVNFSQGLLFKTEDGGATWTTLNLPLGAPARFSSDLVGWTAGGPTNGELYVTRDGGRSWQPQTIIPSTEGPVAYTLPTFANEQEGAVAVTRYGPGPNRVELYLTQDGGQSWQLADSAALRQSLALGAQPPLDVLDGQHWRVAGADSQAAWPNNIIALEFATPLDGWAYTRDDTCPVPCQATGKLLRTGDGGQSWQAVDLP